MIFEDLMDKSVVYCLPSGKIDEVVELMRQKEVGAVVVTENNRPVGILTDRDIVIRCLGKNLNTATTEAGQVMSSDLETVTADVSLKQVFEKMRTRKVRRLPVVDNYGKVIGLISSDDLFQWISKELFDISGKLSELVAASGLRRKKLFHSAA